MNIIFDAYTSFVSYFFCSYSHLMFIAMRMIVFFFLSNIDDGLQISAILAILRSLDVIATICIYFVPKVIAAKYETGGVPSRGLNQASSLQSSDQNMTWRQLQRANENTAGFRSGASINESTDYHNYILRRQESAGTTVEKSIQTDLGEIMAESASITFIISGAGVEESVLTGIDIQDCDKQDAGRPPIIKRKPTVTFREVKSENVTEEKDTKKENKTDSIESGNVNEHKILSESDILDLSDRSDQWIPIEQA